MKGRIKRWLTPEEDEWLQEERKAANAERATGRVRDRRAARALCLYMAGEEYACRMPAKEQELCGIHLRKVRRDKSLHAANPTSFQDWYVEFLGRFDFENQPEEQKTSTATTSR